MTLIKDEAIVCHLLQFIGTLHVVPAVLPLQQSPTYILDATLSMRFVNAAAEKQFEYIMKPTR